MLYFVFFVFLYSCYAKSFIDPMRHEVTLTTDRGFESLLNRQRKSEAVTVLLHYSEKIKPHKNFIDSTYNLVAKELKGMIKFVAINCAEYKNNCESAQNTTELKLPAVLLYSPNQVIPPQILFDPDREEISKSALRLVPGNLVEQISLENVDFFLQSHTALPKILLFSSKNTVSVLYKALSNAFKDRVNFGFILPSETALDQKYKIEKRPTLLTIRSTSKKPDVYNGEFNYLSIYAWINVHAETFVKGGGFSISDKVIEKPKKEWLLQKVPEITEKSYKDVCLKSSSSLCMIYIVKKELDKSELEMLYTLADEYPEVSDRGASFRWSWMNLSIEKAFSEVFDIQDSDLPTFVAFHPQKRLRYIKLPKDTKANIQEIRKLLEKIVSGDGRFTLLKNQKLPSFAARQNDKRDEL